MGQRGHVQVGEVVSMNIASASRGAHRGLVEGMAEGRLHD